ncbi:MAG: hypothetical protein M3128_10680 [Verrucomicrobiota bacterium]|nr:hypothetical protein [Verrucomicrobiota bacterium]
MPLALSRKTSLAVLFLTLGVFVALLVLRNLDSRKPSAAVHTVRAEPQKPIEPLQIVLTPLPGDGELDKEIRRLQAKVKVETNRNNFLERLGWAFVAKARTSSDPGFYNLAEQAARVINEAAPEDTGALLLLGHVSDAQHRFAETEQIARRLIAQREFVFDYALLGDALMEQGKLSEAVGAYQKMIDLKPCLQTYSRVSHMRWLKGDLTGAIAVARLAVSASSPREPEPTAWAYTRLAFYQLETGETEQAMRNSDLALQASPDYAPALLMRGRILLARSDIVAAIAPLQRAAEISPLPEYLWTLSDALRANDQITEAEAVETQLSATGAISDPRTFALFLASRGENPALALRLATSELESRHDIFTYDALAWAQLANGQVEKAQENIRQAVSEETKDARLFYHAGAIAAAAGAKSEALDFLHQAHALEQMLLPSERLALGQRSAALLENNSQISSK